MSTPADRKKAELSAKLCLIREELEFWQQLSSQGGVLEKHHSQLIRLSHMLDSALFQLDAQREDVESWASTTEQLLGVHHVWNFFRSKLALRLVDRFRPPLIAADELAWACVRPLYAEAVKVGKLSVADIREPPLVYFDTSASPFALGRRHAYRNLLPARLLSEVPSKLVRQLPVPVIGIPWHQQAHLPETAIVAHEAAHIADDDLGLTETLISVVDEQPETTPDLMKTSDWFPEALADVLAALWLGPAFGQALSDLISASPASSDPNYPPVGVRLQIVSETLSQLGHSGSLPSPMATAKLMQPEEATWLVNTIIKTPLPVLGGAALFRFGSFTPARQLEAVAGAQSLQDGVLPRSTDPRLLIAAGVYAFTDAPDWFVQEKKAALLFARIVSLREAGTRAEVVGNGVAISNEIKAHDQQAGQDVFQLLRSTT